MKYEIYLVLKLEARDQVEALRLAAACVENWTQEDGFEKISGVGRACGHLTIREKE